MGRTIRLIAVGALAGFITSELLQRRKLRRVIRRLNYEGQLMHTAIVVTHKIRGEVDVNRILRSAVEEVSRTMSITHCLIEIFDVVIGNMHVCSCGKPQHDAATAQSMQVARQNIGVTATDRYVVNGSGVERRLGSSIESIPLISLPLVASTGSIGFVFVAATDCSRNWVEAEVQMLMAVAHQVSLAVEHAHLFMTKEQESLTDPLTGCLNRRGLDLQLEKVLDRVVDATTPVSVLMVDIDHFKRLNDAFGHDVGDQVLMQISKLLLDIRSENAFVGRYGGEEFVVVLQRTTADDAKGAAERLRQEIAALCFPGEIGRVTASFGVASFPRHARVFSELLKAADVALYNAKRQGRDRVCVAESDVYQ
jgi:diguanylate cyclase (GGDEF)-like protein